MTAVLWLLAVQGVIGAFDTLYYHEWRARLPARGARAAPELKLHAARSILYAALFGSLPWVAWHGLWVVALGAILLAEILITLADFVVERRVRGPLGDVYAGERVTHAVMGIVYGAMVAFLLPVLGDWWSRTTAIAATSAVIPEALRWTLSIMAAGVLLSGLRDLYAVWGTTYAAWPWGVQASAQGCGAEQGRPADTQTGTRG